MTKEWNFFSGRAQGKKVKILPSNRKIRLDKILVLLPASAPSETDVRT